MSGVQEKSNKMMVRKIDHQGRISIPIEWRREVFGNTRVEMIIEWGRLIFRKFNWEAIEKREYIGIVRQYDKIGRVIIPTEMLDALKISHGTEVVLILESDKIRIIPKDEMKDSA